MLLASFVLDEGLPTEAAYFAGAFPTGNALRVTKYDGTTM